MKFLYLLFSIGLLLYVSDLFWACSEKVVPDGAEATYVGEASCSSCHQQEAKDWRGSHHDLAMQEVSDSTVLGDFSGAELLSKGIRSRFFKKGNRFIVHTEGPEGTLQDFEIAYVFGVFPLQQYLVRFPGGRLQALHLAWDSRDGKWFDLQPKNRFRPDDWMHWTKGSMTWNNMCADCHSTNLQKNYDPETDTYQTTWAILDVSCEACHGPGSRHLEYVRSSDYQKGRKVQGSFLHLTPALDNKQQVDQCARCHSLRSNQSLAYEHNGVYADHYGVEIPKPNLYHADGQIIEEVYEYGSFTQSRMYQQGVKCSNCHNPHSLKLRAEGNALCAQCHAPKTYDVESHHFHPLGSTGAQCVNCHMPGKYYMGNDFRRDHSLRAPRPDLSARYGTPNACNNCHSEKGLKWQADAVVAHFGEKRKPHYSEAFLAFHHGEQGAAERIAALLEDTAQSDMAKAMAVWNLSSSQQAANWEGVFSRALKSPVPFIRHSAVDAFQAFPLASRVNYLAPMLEDPVRSVRISAAFMLADAGASIPKRQKEAYDKALAEAEQALLAQSDFSGGRLRKAQLKIGQGDMVSAEKAFQSALRLDQDHAPAVSAAANFYYGRGQFDKAAIVYRQFLARNPSEAWANYELGLLLAEMQRLAEATSYLGKAAAGSDDPRYSYNWGLALQNLGKSKEAEQAFLSGLQKAPGQGYLEYALAVLYYQQGNLEKARKLAQGLLKKEPRNAEYAQLAQALGL